MGCGLRGVRYRRRCGWRPRPRRPTWRGSRWSPSAGRPLIAAVALSRCWSVRPRRDGRGRRGSDHAAMGFVTWFGTAGLGSLAPLLVVRGRRLRRGARSLFRTLQSQHHLILSLSKDRSAPHGSAAQDRLGSSQEGISETQPAQGGG